jgi:hypothetical protein
MEFKMRGKKSLIEAKGFAHQALKTVPFVSRTVSHGGADPQLKAGAGTEVHAEESPDFALSFSGDFLKFAAGTEPEPLGEFHRD